jgi:hypothetical protein
MPPKTAPEKTQAEVPYSLLEYSAVFKKPIVEAFGTPAILIAAVLNVLEPWGFALDGVEAKTHTEKLSEYAVIFRRSAPPGLSLTLGLGKVVVTAENLVWAEAEHFIAQMSAALNAILQTGRAEVQSQHVGIGMHIQLKTKPRKDVTARLLDPVAFTILDGEVKFPGIILFHDKSSIVIDASLAHANGLFVRIAREHPPEATLQQLAEALHKDEEQLFNVLGLEGIL